MSELSGLRGLNAFASLILGVCVSTLVPNFANTEPIQIQDINKQQVESINIIFDITASYHDLLAPNDVVIITYTPNKGQPKSGTMYNLMSAMIFWIEPSEDQIRGGSILTFEVEPHDAKRLRLAQQTGTLGLLLISIGDEPQICANRPLSWACFMGPAWFNRDG